MKIYDYVNETDDGFEKAAAFIENNFTNEEKLEFIMTVDKNNVDTHSDFVLALFVRLTEELCEADYPEALAIKAYCCYGGNSAYPCDWALSRDLLLRNFELTFDPYTANTLGYIYYYGRVDGAPDYANAYKYFFFGAKAGIFESIYKISDMYGKGLFVEKNEEMAFRMLDRIYDENLEFVLKENFDCKYADIALRLGNMFRKSNYIKPNRDTAMRLFLQAEYSIRKRRMVFDGFGDEKVERGIKETLDELYSDYTDDDLLIPPVVFDFQSLFKLASKDCHRLVAKIKKNNTGTYDITFSSFCDKATGPMKLFLTLPENRFCELVDSFTVRTDVKSSIRINGKRFSGDDETIIFNEVVGNSFSIYGDEVMHIFGPCKIV